MKPSVPQFVAVALGIVAPIRIIAYAIGFLVAVDVLTGMWASIKTGQKITSDRFSRTVTKSLVYLVALIVAHVAEVYVFEGAAPILKVVSGFIGSTELLSTYENLSRISGLDFKKAIMDRIRPPQLEKQDRDAPPPEA